MLKEIPSFSLRGLLILASIAFAYLLGYAIATESLLGILLLAVPGLIIILFVIILVPAELIILGSILLTLLADSWLIPSQPILLYLRFVPIGILALRALTDYVLTQHQFKVSRLFLIPTSLFALYALISTVYSIDPWLTLQRTLSMIFVIIAFGIGLPLYMPNAKQMENGTKWVITCLTLVILTGTVLSYFDPRSQIPYETFTRFNGIFVNSNTQGIIAMILVFSLVWWWLTSHHSFIKIVLAIVILMIIGVAIASGSRSSLVALLAGGAAFAWLQRHSSLSRVLVFIALLTLPFLFTISNPAVAAGILREGDSGRLFLWQRALELGMPSPIWGVGFTASDLLFAQDVPYLQSIGVYVYGPHSSYMRLFVDLGIVGIVFGLVVFIPLVGRVLSAKPAIQQDVLVSATFATVLAGLVNVTFESWLFSFGNAETIVFWFALALLALRLELLTQEQSPPAPAPSPTPIRLRRIQR